MRKRMFLVLICVGLLLGMTGCKNEDVSLSESNEKFVSGHTLDDGRVIHFTFDVPYKDGYLSEALIYNEITINDLINELSFVSGLNDGGSKLYKYNRSEKIFGNKDFYVLVCNSYNGIKDIFVARNTKRLADNCIIKIDDLDGVSMTIKDGTLTKKEATIIITDMSSRNNIYGEEYRIDKLVNGEWQELEIIFEGNYGWTSIGYSVGGDNRLELEVNWEWLYGELEPGDYRIVKTTSEPGEATTHYITAEFIIE